MSEIDYVDGESGITARAALVATDVGMLAYFAGEHRQRQLIWHDRKGQVQANEKLFRVDGVNLASALILRRLNPANSGGRKARCNSDRQRTDVSATKE